MMKIVRRKFLMLSLGGATTLAGGLILMRRGTSIEHPEPDSNLISKQSRALGTDVTITVSQTDQALAHEAINAAFAELETVENVMSLYRPDSQICQLNQHRVLHRPHPYLIDVLTESQSMSNASNGAFDITVQPIWNLFATAQKQGSTPTPEQIKAVQASVDWRAVEINPDRVVLKEPLQAITLNGIAQGFATDRVVEVLRSFGIKHALINAGELCPIGNKSESDDWKVGIQHPRQSDAFIALASLDGRALATSGDYETTFTPDFARNHILDPRTGSSPTELASVSIAAPTAMQADALSTAAMVLGSEQTFELIRHLPSVDAFMVLKSGRVMKSARFPEVREGLSG